MTLLSRCTVANRLVVPSLPCTLEGDRSQGDVGSRVFGPGPSVQLDGGDGILLRKTDYLFSLFTPFIPCVRYLGSRYHLTRKLDLRKLYSEVGEESIF